MPNTAHVPGYKLHKPSGQARVIIRGRHHYLGPYGSPESREKYARLLAELAVGTEPQDSPPAPGALADKLVVEVLARYWEFAQGYYVKNGVPSGWLVHIRLILRLVREHYAHPPAPEFGLLAFKAPRQKLIDAGPNGGFDLSLGSHGNSSLSSHGNRLRPIEDCYYSKRIRAEPIRNPG